MDPNATVKEAVELAKQITEAIDNDRQVDSADADRLAQLVIALDTWLRKGGFLPDAWQYYVPRPERLIKLTK